MKKIIFVLASLSGFLSFSQMKNSLLERSFWTKNTSVEAVKKEIENGNNPAQLTDNAFDPVSIAINNDAPFETIVFLLQQPGNQVDKLTHDGRTYLHWAAGKGNVLLVKYLLEKGFSVSVKDTKKMTPLAHAATLGQIIPEMYQLFFDAGVNPKEIYTNGENLLHLSIANDIELKLANYLITKGLSFLDTDVNGYTIFDHACKKGNVSLLQKLREKGVKFTPQALLFAAQGARRFSNTFEVYKYLVNDLKINPLSVNKQNQNVLHFLASKEKQEEIVTFFLENKVSVNQQDKNGNTPFINAGSNKDTRILELFLPKVINVNQTNKKGETALSNAVLSGSVANVNLLLKKGANTKLSDKSGNNLAYFLVEGYRSQNEKDFDEKLSVLKAKKVDFSKKQSEGNNLYHLAVLKNDITLLQKIKELGVNINQKNNAGETPLIKAVLLAKNTDILKFLVETGANKNATTHFGETAYQLAQENEMLKEKNVNIEFLK